MDDEKWGPDKEEEGGVVAVVEEGKPKEVMEIDNLKKALVDSFYGTDRWLTETSEMSRNLQVYILFLFVPLIVKGFIAIGESGGGISDN
ncbi:hypothetical protein Pint_25985 [Pistacia integerrima]|uniref:Uncharacterized protein n=1 Tax=Pistacia integerrima TaxID=434235 RepID=A0ACC0YCW3_9ROSI|nr:hypothetical protein Pint_25985 [Pistacia integerrima]